jgi:hypothetical protein
LDDYPFDLNQDEQKELRINPEGMYVSLYISMDDRLGGQNH